MTQKAAWTGYNWQTPVLRRVRIKEGVRPFGGRLVELVSEDQATVTIVPPHPAQPIERVYRRDEVEEVGQK